MWKILPDFHFPDPIVEIILSIACFPYNRAAAEIRAAEEAAMWRGIFWVAVIVIVIAVLAFLIWREHRRAAKEAE